MVDDKNDRSKKSDSDTTIAETHRPFEKGIPLSDRVNRKDSDVERPKPKARGPIPPAKKEG